MDGMKNAESQEVLMVIEKGLERAEIYGLSSINNNSKRKIRRR